jgi:two-component system response regulator
MKTKPLVFLIEDDVDDQYIFKMVTEELEINLDLIIFEHGLAAYQALTKVCELGTEFVQEQLPDLILLDLNLPVWDGKKTLSVLKKDQRLQRIPIIIYTTSKSEYDVEDCYQLGANSFISKAAEYGDLKQQIKEFFTYWINTVTL